MDCVQVGGDEVRSTNKSIRIKKATNLGVMPLFISMMHRHLEKEKPVGEKVPAGVNYALPIDLLSLSIDDKSLLKEVSGVTLTYRTK